VTAQLYGGWRGSWKPWHTYGANGAGVGSVADRPRRLHRARRDPRSERCSPRRALAAPRTTCSRISTKTYALDARLARGARVAQPEGDGEQEHAVTVGLGREDDPTEAVLSPCGRYATPGLVLVGCRELRSLLRAFGVTTR
jgi:hypothetical protein